MCARYEMSASPRAIMAQFHLDAPPPVPNTDDMRPTDQALIIARFWNGAAWCR